MKASRTLIGIASAVTLAATLSACGTTSLYEQPRVVSQQPAGVYPGNYPAQPGYVQYGRVTEVALIRPATTVSGAGPGQGSGAGAVLGAVVGGVVGNQIGSGMGRAAATILGAVGGAALGNRIENRPNYATTSAVYRVSVQTDAGQMLTYDVSATGDLRPGDRVRIENGVIYLA